MQSEEIEINHQKIDLNESQSLSLCIKSNLLKKVSDFSCCYSYTYEVPLTETNKSILGPLLIVGNSNKRVREKLPATYYRDGLKIFDGTCYVSASNLSSASVVFLFGINTAFQKLKDDDININQLFNNPKESGVVDYTTQETLDYKFTVPIASFSAFASAPFTKTKATEIFFGKYIYNSTIAKATILPSVNVANIMDLLKERYGIEVESGVNEESVWVMCDSLARRDKFKLVLHGVKKVLYTSNGVGGEMWCANINADYYTDTDNNFKALFPEIDYGGRVTIYVPNPPVSDSEFCPFANIKEKYNVDRVKIRINGCSSSELSVIYVSTGSYTIDTLEAREVAKITELGGSVNIEFSPKEMGMQKEYEAGTSPVIRVIPSGAGVSSDFSILDFHVEYECSLCQEKATLGWFNSIDCLPSIKVIDFLQNIYFGCGGEYFVNSLKGGNKVTAISLEGVSTNTPYDWSDKLLSQELKQNYKIEGLARKNYITYKNGDKEAERQDMVPTEDETINEETKIFESSFGFYDAPNIWSHNTDLSKLAPSPKLIGVNPIGSYVYVNSEEGTFICAKTFNQNMKWLNEQNVYQNTMKEPLTIECKLHFTSVDIATLDLTRPVWFSQFGANFFIDEIKVSGDTATAKLIKLGV